MNRKITNQLLIVCVSVVCVGCQQAPSVDIIGSFFPVWMICIAIAVVLAFVTHYVLSRYQLETEIGPPALFYPCVITLFTCLLWLIFFR